MGARWEGDAINRLGDRKLVTLSYCKVAGPVARAGIPASIEIDIGPLPLRIGLGQGDRLSIAVTVTS